MPPNVISGSFYNIEQALFFNANHYKIGENTKHINCGSQSTKQNGFVRNGGVRVSPRISIDFGNGSWCSNGIF